MYTVSQKKETQFHNFFNNDPILIKFCSNQEEIICCHFSISVRSLPYILMPLSTSKQNNIYDNKTNAVLVAKQLLSDSHMFQKVITNRITNDRLIHVPVSRAICLMVRCV